jgi:hypothetical protein
MNAQVFVLQRYEIRTFVLQEMNFSATVEQVDDVLAGKLVFIDWKSGRLNQLFNFSLIFV